MSPAIRRVEPAENEVLAALEAKARQPSAFFRVMANRPEALKNFPPFYSAVLGAGSVERRIKAEVYLAVSFANRCAFCSATHMAGGRKAGLTDEEIGAIRGEKDAGFSDPERAALAYARELTRTASALQTRDALRQHFTDEQVVEITLVAAMANFTNRFNNALDVQP